MARILFAWELGGGFGHIERTFNIGERMRARGATCIYAMRDFTRAITRRPDPSIRVIPAPFLLYEPQRTMAINYADVLLRTGWDDTGVLGGLVEGWRRILEVEQPDIIAVDHAPAALLAARIDGVARITLGNGFQLPPDEAPTPSIQPWKDIKKADLKAMDRAALETANHVLKAAAAPELAHVAGLFDDANMLTSMPAIDAYGRTDPALFTGHIWSEVGSIPAPWAMAPGHKAFVYLNARAACFEPVLKILSDLKIETLIYGRDLAHEQKNRLAALPGLHVSDQMVHIRQAAGVADFVVCHGGHGTAGAALLGGAPVLCVPEHLEQMLTGWQLNRQKLGAMLTTRAVEQQGAAAIRFMLANAQLKDSVTALGKSLSPDGSEIDMAAHLDNAADRIEARLAA